MFLFNEVVEAVIVFLKLPFLIKLNPDAGKENYITCHYQSANTEQKPFMKTDPTATSGKTSHPAYCMILNGKLNCVFKSIKLILSKSQTLNTIE